MTFLSGELSLTLARFADSVMVLLSSSVSETLVLVIVAPVVLPSTVIVSLPSINVSCVGVRVKVPVALVCPAGMVSVKSATVA